MQRTEQWPRSTNAGLFATVWITLVLIAALLQCGAVVVWWSVMVTAPLASVTTAVATLVLVGGLIAHQLFTETAATGPGRTVPVDRLATLGLIEASGWVTWLLVADALGGLRGLAIAGIGLLALLVVTHSIEVDVLRGERRIAEAIDYGTVPYSLVAALGGTMWLSLATRGDLFGLDPSAVGLGGISPLVAGTAVLATVLVATRAAAVLYARY
ncbi:hypothetical protein [Halomicrobium salinisoli]|uniref:hypothetical protein n=1 Tax=Halomicrobium salinisoli TaxID=2878391 RepID=UPI001CF0AC85|nr:hypothetical protein [Halomicrobium salinisoli]